MVNLFKSELLIREISVLVLYSITYELLDKYRLAIISQNLVIVELDCPYQSSYELNYHSDIWHHYAP